MDSQQRGLMLGLGSTQAPPCAYWDLSRTAAILVLPRGRDRKVWFVCNYHNLACRLKIEMVRLEQIKTWVMHSFLVFSMVKAISSGTNLPAQLQTKNERNVGHRKSLFLDGNSSLLAFLVLWRPLELASPNLPGAQKSKFFQNKILKKFSC